VYCDIPYQGTKQYGIEKNFDYPAFYDWCRIKKSENHSVFVSEYQAPKDFICVWEKEITNSMNTKNTYKPIERLFTI